MLTEHARYIALLKEASKCLEKDEIVQIALVLFAAIKKDTPIYVCGNGGSASMADHFVIDLMKMGGAKNVHSLASNNAVITAVANDSSYKDIFAAQLQGADARSLLIAISSSGSSENVIRAARVIRHVNGIVLGISGKVSDDYNPLLAISNYAFAIPSKDTQIIEDITGSALHLIARVIHAMSR
jgi:D-sedoheptulose 7-phosphate isomerase